MLLLGREEERAALERTFRAASDGLSGVLVLRGPAGIGKTSLLREAVDAADGLRVARLTGHEAETGLGFAGLQRLLAPFRAGIDNLPAPQRDALGTALGLVAGPPADRFLVALATLGLLSDAAVETPLLCAIDDAQWLDRETLEALAFVARRLEADRIAMVFAVRETAQRLSVLDGLPERRLHELTVDQATALLQAITDVPLDHAVMRRLVQATGGNPLALIELAGELTEDELAGKSVLAELLPVGPSLSRHYLRQLQALPDASQRLLLLIAAEPSADPALVFPAAGSVGIAPDAVDAARSADLVVAAPGLEFRHPLIRAAVYQGATDAERRDAHATIAAAMDPEREPDRRAWHLAAAATAVDEELAEQLERCAERARRRGGYDAEVRYLTRAAELTPDASTRGKRRFAAALVAGWSGATDMADVLLAQALPDIDDPTVQAQARWFQALTWMPHQAYGDAAVGMLAAARRLYPIDPLLARESVLDAFQAFHASAHRARHTDGRTIGTTGREMPPPAGAPERAPCLLLDGLSLLMTDGPAAAAPSLRAAAAAWNRADVQPEHLIRWARIIHSAGRLVWDEDALETWAATAVRAARDHHALLAQLFTAFIRSTVDCQFGRLFDAEAVNAETQELADTIGPPYSLSATVDVELLAWRGRLDETRAAAGALAAAAVDSCFGGGECAGQLALAIAELAAGQYPEALAAARRAGQGDALEYSMRALPEVVEAATRCDGAMPEAVEATERLAAYAAAAATPWALGVLTRTRALVAADEDAEPLYVDAVRVLAGTRARPDHARACLLYGEWLRRQRRRRDAREQLRSAVELFEVMGADGFAERARRELAATGETSRKRTEETALDLTPRELQIARLAARGATNAEIGLAVFVSPHTVGYHLRHIFTKLGITSRRQLAEVLADA